MKYIAYKESKITEEKRKENNEMYIQTKLIEEKKYLDTMFNEIDKNIKLDNEQRRIILTDEDNIMVIAGAGSGKTTTISAKVNYLIQKQKIKDEEIIVISFTNKAVQELNNRINNDFKHKVKVTTFHKLAYEIIKNNTKKIPKIIPNETKIIKDYIEEKLIKNSKKLKQFMKLYPKYFDKRQYKKEIYIKFVTLCETYINLSKSKGIKPKEIEIKQGIPKNKKVFLQFIKELYEYYQNELIKTNQIDFNEMINKASEIIKNNNKINLKYKYIIIDEYQDISESRFNLIKDITSKIKNKTMIVGDDWQCIYSFASSNINLFTNYKKSVDYCEVLKITKTYRNSQELIDIAGEFIQKNPKQIKKHLISEKTNSTPITILKYKKEKIIESLTQALDYIIIKYGTNKTILLLGRYTFDINKIIDNINIKNIENIIIYKKKPSVKIEFMTIHSAKGLGYDNVIIINTLNQKLGFPSKIKPDPLIKNLISQEKCIKYAEERRLFYVALTRTKNETIILTPKINPSKFIKEIKKYKNVRIKRNIKKIIK